MRHVSKFVAAAAGLACAAGLAFAADQTILGKSLTVKQKPGDATSRKITGSGKEKGSTNTFVGDPTKVSANPNSPGGAFLDIYANCTNSTSQRFALPNGSWKASGTSAFKYKGTSGAVKSVTIKRTKSGVFSIKAKILGKGGPVDVVPPNAGVSGCMALLLKNCASDGDRYSVEFGPTSKITNNADKVFKAKKPTAEGVCPLPGSTTTTTTVVSTTVSTTTPTTTTTSTTIYGSPSRAFLATPVDLLD